MFSPIFRFFQRIFGARRGVLYADKHISLEPGKLININLDPEMKEISGTAANVRTKEDYEGLIDKIKQIENETKRKGTSNAAMWEKKREYIVLEVLVKLRTLTIEERSWYHQLKKFIETDIGLQLTETDELKIFNEDNGIEGKTKSIIKNEKGRSNDKIIIFIYILVAFEYLDKKWKEKNPTENGDDFNTKMKERTKMYKNALDDILRVAGYSMCNKNPEDQLLLRFIERNIYNVFLYADCYMVIEKRREQHNKRATNDEDTFLPLPNLPKLVSQKWKEFDQQMIDTLLEELLKPYIKGKLYPNDHKRLS